jgi:phage tail sheath gpL-like
MAVSFNRIPANIRVPLFYAEVSNELAGHLSMQQPALIIGPVIEPEEEEENGGENGGSGGNGTHARRRRRRDVEEILHKPVLVTSTSMAYELFGAGSVLADMVNTYRANDTFGELWVIPVGAGTGAEAAKGTVTITGTATEGGNLPFYIGGDLYRVGVANGATAVSVAAALAGAINNDPFGLITAEINPAERSEISIIAKQKGTLGNEIDLAVAWRGLAAGEMVPPGIAVDIEPMQDGAGIPLLAPALEAMGDDVYDFCVQPWTDGASLDAVQAAMDDTTGRWAWDRQVYGHFFTAKMGTVGALQTFGKTRNDQHNTVHGFPQSPSPPWRRGAALTAQAATALRIDPARPLQTLPLLGVLAPERDTKFTISHRQTLLHSGIAVEDDVAGQVRINRCITTYQRNVWGQPDPSYLDVTTMATLAYFIRTLRSRILQKFPRHKLADDGTPFGAGQAIVTPRIIKAELVAAYLEMATLGIVENIDSFQQLLIVERDPTDPNRVNVLASPDLVNQLRVLGVLVAFRLRTTQQDTALAA